MTKEDIIDRIADLSAAEIVSYIVGGHVTFEELCKERNFARNKRKEVKALLEQNWNNNHSGGDQTPDPQEQSGVQNPVPEDEVAWNSLDKSNKQALLDFIADYPLSSHVAEAEALLDKIIVDTFTDPEIIQLINALEDEHDPEKIQSTVREYVEAGKISAEDVYKEIKRDHNFFNVDILKELVKNNVITIGGLERKCSIDHRFITQLYECCKKEKTPDVIEVVPNDIEELGKNTSEIYFWGIPSSGKTCALGTILDELRSGRSVTSVQPEQCKGWDYMGKLADVFNGRKGVLRLPGGTSTDATFEMRYTIKKGKTKYPITFVDLAGETIYSMHLDFSELPLESKQQKGLDTACRILKGNSGVNRKIHFFVIEYNGHEREYKNLSQNTLLHGAMAYIKKMGIFKTETDAIYLLVTKSDLSGATDKETRNRLVKDYLNQYYRPFYELLKSICEENEINDGNVEIIPFSSGEVCFQNLCLSNNETAATVVDLILSRAKGFETGGRWTNKLIDLLRR